MNNIAKSILTLILLSTLWFWVGYTPTASQQNAPFTLLADFETLSVGNIDLQGEWHANEPGAAAGALVDNDPPLIFTGNALRNNPNNVLSRGNAYLSLGDNQLPEGEVSTLFFQVAVDDPGQSNFSVGLSDASAPDIFTAAGLDEYVAELNISADGIQIRDGDSYLRATNIGIGNGVLTHIWMIVDHDQNRYQIYVDNQNLEEPLLVETSNGNSFAFYNGEAGPLLTFVIQNVGINSGDSYIDNVAVAIGASTLANPAPAFRLIDDFDTAAIGNLNGQNGWSAVGNVEVVANPSEGGRAVALMGNAAQLTKAMQIADEAEGTIHFRMRRNGVVDGFAGGSAQSNPTEWADFEAQFGTQWNRANTFLVRDGDDFRELADTFGNDAWSCVWLVINNPNDSYRVYVKGGDYNQVTQLFDDDVGDFSLRNGGENPMRQFYARVSPDSVGTIYLDNIYYDPAAANLTEPSQNCGSSAPPTVGPGEPVTDPIPERIQSDGTTVRFETIITLPQSTSGELDPRSNPRTRLNFAFHARDDSGRLFANDLRGQLYAIYPNERRFVEYLNIKNRFSQWFESRGLNSGFSTFAFHPDFKDNGLLYTIHTESPNGTPDYSTFAEKQEPVHGVLVEWRTDDPSAETFVGDTNREILRIEQAAVIHGMQLVQFNPLAAPGDTDYGMIYVSNGDGESSPQFSDAAQNLGSLQGTIFRIDPAGTNGPNGKYGIPSTNPFSSGAGSILKEIYAYGFRNPNRFTWDPVTRKMILAGIGQNNIEEINLIVPGANYGWNEREGTFVFDRADPDTLLTLPTNDEDLGYTYPVAQYDHDEGFAIMGGFVYHGSLMPHMVGNYIFGDIVQGHLFYVNVEELIQGQLAPIRKLVLEDENGSEIPFKQLVDPQEQRADLRFGLDGEGEIYIMSKQDGVVRRLVSGNTPPSATPMPTATFTKTPAPLTATATTTLTPVGTETLPSLPTSTGTSVGQTATVTMSPTMPPGDSQTASPVITQEPNPSSTPTTIVAAATPTAELTATALATDQINTPTAQALETARPDHDPTANPTTNPAVQAPPSGAEAEIKVHLPIVAGIE